jgi:hypothetical protein
MAKTLFWLMVLLLLGVSGLYLVGRFAPRAATGAPGGNSGLVECTADAKVCDDGSSVGRNPAKNCEFYPCPAAKAPIKEEEPIACTADAKLCEDGSAVGRQGERGCAFAPCPGEGTVTGTVTLAPTCPYEQAGHPCPTSSYDGELRLEPAAGGVISTTWVRAGKLYATLAPGTYKISTGKVLPRCDASFTVRADEETAFSAVCDSGIR